MITQYAYTDGACKGNPGIGAWAYMISADEQGNIKIASNSSVKLTTTNNEMELTAINEVLKYLSNSGYNKNLIIFSDSSYAINSISVWSDKWIKDGSILYRPNGELIKEIKQNITKFNNVNFVKVAGHSGVYGNEFVDSLCNKSINSYLTSGITDTVPSNYTDDKIKISMSLDKIEEIGDQFILHISRKDSESIEVSVNKSELQKLLH